MISGNHYQCIYIYIYTENRPFVLVLLRRTPLDRFLAKSKKRSCGHGEASQQYQGRGDMQGQRKSLGSNQASWYGRILEILLPQQPCWWNSAANRLQEPLEEDDSPPGVDGPVSVKPSSLIQDGTSNQDQVSHSETSILFYKTICQSYYLQQQVNNYDYV